MIKSEVALGLLLAVVGFAACTGDGPSNETQASIPEIALAPEEPLTEELTSDDVVGGDLLGDEDTTPLPSTLDSTSATVASRLVDDSESESEPEPEPRASTVDGSSVDPSTEPSNSTPDDLGGEDDPLVENDEPADAPPPGRAGVQPPDDALIDLSSGASTELADTIGDDLTLLWFWSTDTPTSERESAVVQRFATTFAGSVEVVAVGSGGERSDADEFLQGTGLDVTTLWSADDGAAAHYQIDSLPQSLLVDSSGNIIGSWPGLPEETFRLVERIT